MNQSTKKEAFCAPVREGFEYVWLNDFNQFILEFFESEEDLMRFMDAKGHPFTGNRRLNHRGYNSEIVGKPIFENIIGPMRGCHRSIRYESPAVYERLSV